jgi:hypothetical protein
MTNTKNNTYVNDVIAVLVLVAISILLRIVYLQTYLNAVPDARFPSNDAKEYWDLGRIIYQQGWLLQGYGPFYQAPLYPYILAVFHHFSIHDVYSVLFIQAGIGIGNVILCFLLARQQVSTKRSFIAAFLFALCHYSLFFESKILASTLGLFVLLSFSLLFIFWLQKRNTLILAVSALCISLAVLCRPNFIFTIPFIGLFIFWRTVKSENYGWACYQSILWIVIFLIGIAPVPIRNYVIGGDLVPISANAGVTLYMGTNPDAQGGLAVVEGLPNDIVNQKHGSVELAMKLAGKELTPSEASWFWVKKTGLYIIHHPFQFILLECKKLLWAFYYAPPSVNYSAHFESQFIGWMSILSFFTWLVVFAGLMSIPLLLWENDHYAKFLLVIVFGYILLILVYYASDRFIYTMLPFFSIAMVMVFPSWEAIKSRVTTKWITWCGCCIFLTLNPFLHYNRSQEIGMGYYNLGVFYESRNDFYNAQESYLQAIEFQPNHASALLNLGVIYAKQGDLARSSTLFKRVLEIDSQNTKARQNLEINNQRLSK